MSDQNPLYLTMEATVEWQEAMNRGMQSNAVTLEGDSALLAYITQEQNRILDRYMAPRSDTNPYGRPTDTSDTKKYPTEVQVWQAAYNECVQKFQELTNRLNAVIQSEDQEEQSLGNASQQASQMATTVTQPVRVAGNLLGQYY